MALDGSAPDKSPQAQDAAEWLEADGLGVSVNGVRAPPTPPLTRRYHGPAGHGRDAADQPLRPGQRCRGLDRDAGSAGTA